ncbi:hypothetical protein J4404_02070 [Candidatus Woesearchaeota archaeon]|nr:hypothetical protein [Candidatus Woesearchaeota archaeon]
MEFRDKNTIKLNKIINELDKFVLDFTRILEKYANYVIISGYISILFGRARSTENIDVFIKKIDKEKFYLLYSDLKKNDYWCLNAESPDDVYEYLKEGLAVRFAKKSETIPNIEVKFINKKLDADLIKESVTVITKEGSLKISSIERQIAFKKYYLKSDKDIEDAKHLEEIFKNKIDLNKIKKYKKMIENEA